MMPIRLRGESDPCFLGDERCSLLGTDSEFLGASALQDGSIKGGAHRCGTRSRCLGMVSSGGGGEVGLG